jgi:hypothetical protein
MLRKIHSEAKNLWIDTIDTNIHLFQGKSMADKMRLLENFAAQIKGIGPESIMETYLLWIEHI